jgi:hypothetical protein
VIYIGVDPGGSGAMARVRDDKVLFVKNDDTESELHAWLELAKFAAVTHKCGLFAYIERVHSMPKQGVASSFKFGQSYGFLRGLLIACKIPFEEVSPVKWQTAMGCRSGGDKNVTKARAQQLFPDVRITHANADAILLAEYCRRTRSPSVADITPSAREGA